MPTRDSLQPNKKQVKNRLTVVELAIAKLADSFAGTTYRQNELISDCIKNANDELHDALKNLFAENFSESFELAGIAWLYADFGQQILEAEQVEHMLGESDFIELSEISIPWQGKAFEILEQLEEKIQLLRADIAQLTVAEKQ